MTPPALCAQTYVSACDRDCPLWLVPNATLLDELCRGTQSWLVSGSRAVLVGEAVLEKLPSHRSPPGIQAPHDPLSSQAVAVVRQRWGSPCLGPRGPRLPSRVARHPCSRDALPAKWPSGVVVAGLVPEIFHHILNTNSGKRSHFPNWQVFFRWEIPRSRSQDPVICTSVQFGIPLLRKQVYFHLFQ